MILERVRVTDYAAEGKSIARLEGKVIFIERAIPGDLVDVQVKKNKKDWAEGVAVALHEPSEFRVDPFCQHFGICGGCQWQMLPYAKQLEYKEQQVRETLRRIGKVDLPQIQPILGSDITRYYRNKLEFTFGNRRYLKPEELNNPAISGEQDVLGFHVRGFFDKIVDIETCYLQPEPSNAIRLAIKQFALREGYSFYDIRGHHGLMRTLQLRICSSGEVMVNVVFAEDDPPKIKALMEFLLDQFPEISTLLYTINTKMNDSLNDLEPVTWFGKGYVLEKLRDANGHEWLFKIGPKSFFQTNTKQAERLYQVTHDLAGLTGDQVLYDLYCGTGSIGIFCSQGAKRVIGVELIEEAIADARENAALNKIEDARFFAGDAGKICTDEFFAAHGRPDVVITDPPRAGMHEQLITQLKQIAAPTVVYVSCNPATQARDLALLDEMYAVTYIQPVDMFPHTHHIENVVQLKKR